LSHPLRFLRWSGILAHRPVSYVKFNPVHFDAPGPFDASPPPGVTVDDRHRITTTGATMSHVIAIEQGLANSDGQVFDRNGRLVEGATHKHRGNRAYLRWVSMAGKQRVHPRVPRLERYSGEVAVLTASTQHIYFHWLHEVLARMQMAEQSSSRRTLYYIDAHLPVQRETLDLLGIGPDRIINAADTAVLQADRLLIPCHQIMNGREFPEWSLRYLRDCFLPSAGAPAGRGTRRLYVSRRASRHRRIRNEEAVLHILERFGFEEYVAERFSFREQVRSFGEAEAVVAPHGSGLANIVFCRPGTTVVELFPGAFSDLYYRLAAAMELSYRALGGDAGPAWTTADYSIDPVRLSTVVNETGLRRYNRPGA